MQLPILDRLVFARDNWARTLCQARTGQRKVFPGFAHRLDIETEELKLNYFATHPDESAQVA
ncbi:MAG: hypothetical protein WD627_00140, partial [Actinomycetota bacterium]